MGELFRNTKYLFKLLNYMVSSMVFLNLTLILIGNKREEIHESRLTKVNETNLTERSSMMRTKVGEILTSGGGRNDLVSEIKITFIRYQRKPFNVPGYILKQGLIL